jgi:flagellar biosynthesis chaperone FliJ
METFQCIFHSLKHLLDAAQKSQDDSESELERVTQAMKEEKEKLSAAIEPCKCRVV